MGWDGNSHILGRKIYKFQGSEYIKIADSTSLDVTQDFSLSFLIQPDPVARNNYILFTKGHPTDPSLGSISAKCINGVLRVYLHDSNGINSLVYNTTSAILNTTQIIHIEIVWDAINNIFKIYKNAVEQGVSLVLTGSFHTSPANLPSIRTNNDDVEFGRGTGENPYIGRVFDILYLGRARSSTEVFTYFESIKYTGLYTPPEIIAFTTNRTGTTVIGTMTSEGNDFSVLNSTFNAPNFLNYNYDGTKISFTESNGGTFVTGIYSDGNALPTSPVPPSGADLWGSYNYNDPTEYIYSKPAGSFLNIFKSVNGATPVPVLEGTRICTAPKVNHTGNYIFWINDYRYIIRADYPSMNNITTLYDAGTGYPQNAYNLVVSKDGTMLGFSAIVGGYYRVFIMGSGGANPTQMTFTNDSAYFMDFNSDSSKVIYMVGNQLYTINIDGSNNHNISNNAYNESFATFKP